MANFIKVQHGSMELNIPTKLFEPGTNRIRKDEADRLRAGLRAKYPWLTDNAVDVILRNSQEEMARLMDAKRTVAERAREMLRSGRMEQALAFLEAHLDVFPDDADAWYVRGEALMRSGRAKEGFAAMHHARSLSEKKRPGRS
ncbi:MAG: hypothetical protein A4E32_02137 [Methanomassiliicoccales archaeon PtaU1.Bin124]|nr:MAG: hypothetical protein A4E32_02137 [Methanomassiliicoccales archaeon PtaU1.Bin124]